MQRSRPASFSDTAGSAKEPSDGRAGNVLTAGLGCVEAECDDLAVATDISEVGVDAVNGELLANLPELVLRQTSDSAACFRVVS